MTEAAEMKTLSVKLPDALEAKLSALAQKRGVSKSEVVREALEALLVRDRSHRRASALALAKDLAGCLAGPGDLSFNKDYLKGYGR
jgi:predicted transcriptional regulator